MLLCAPPPPARESDWSRHCCCAAQHRGWRVGSLNGTCRRAPLLQLFLRDPLGAAADPGFGVISPSALMRIIPTSSLKAPSCPLSPASPRQAQGSIASAPPPSTHTHTDTTPFQWVYFKWTADTTLGLWEGAAQQRPRPWDAFLQQVHAESSGLPHQQAGFKAGRHGAGGGGPRGAGSSAGQQLGTQLYR